MDCANSIRCFDLGGGGLKTALVKYNHGKPKIYGQVHQLGKCPDDEHVDEWVRRKLKEINVDLNKEANEGYLFGFSLAGLDKLRKREVTKKQAHELFNLPRARVGHAGDGYAHTLSSIRLLKDDLQPNCGRVWNIAIGTGVGFGFTRKDGSFRPDSDIKNFFGQHPWDVEVSFEGSQEPMWKAGSALAYKELEQKYGSERAMQKFGEIWKKFIEKEIVQRSKHEPGKDWGSPNTIVFTGGHIDGNRGKLIPYLKNSFKNNLRNKEEAPIKLLEGPKNAGVLGAALNVLEKTR